MTDKLRIFFFEASVIFLAGVVIAGMGFAVWTLMHPHTLESFRREYAAGDIIRQTAVAEEYLNYFSVEDLNKAIEAEYEGKFCHQQAHALGRALYKKNPNFAEDTRQCGSWCTYGCFHGVMTQMFSTDSDTLGGQVEEETPAEYLSHIESSAQTLCSSAEAQGVVHPRYCYHGLGHVFSYFAGTDLDLAIHRCDGFQTDGQRGSCRSGVFMEYLFSTTSAPVLYTKSEAPCDAYPGFLRRCYRYKAYGWIYAWGGFENALKACDSFGKNTLLCISNVAEAASSPGAVSSEAGFDRICGTLSGDKHTACVHGAILKVLSVTDGDDSEHACDAIVATKRQACLDVREEYRGDLYFEG